MQRTAGKPLQSHGQLGRGRDITCASCHREFRNCISFESRCRLGAVLGEGAGKWSAHVLSSFAFISKSTSAYRLGVSMETSPSQRFPPTDSPPASARSRVRLPHPLRPSTALTGTKSSSLRPCRGSRESPGASRNGRGSRMPATHSWRRSRQCSRRSARIRWFLANRNRPGSSKSPVQSAASSDVHWTASRSPPSPPAVLVIGRDFSLTHRRPVKLTFRPEQSPATGHDRILICSKLEGSSNADGSRKRSSCRRRPCQYLEREPVGH